LKVKVAEKDDVLEGTMRMVQAQGGSYVLAKVSGKLYAIDGICSHRGGELWHGHLNGAVVKCPRHGAEYDVRTGEVVGQVKLPLIGKAQGQRSVTVTVEPDGVYLDV